MILKPRAIGDRFAERAATDAFLKTAAAGTLETTPSISPPGGQILHSMGRAAYPY